MNVVLSATLHSPFVSKLSSLFHDVGSVRPWPGAGARQARHPGHLLQLALRPPGGHQAGAVEESILL